MAQPTVSRKKAKRKSFQNGKIVQPGGAQFLLSAARYSELPKPTGVEYCILGRSNVGKSSFINHILDNKSLARVSKTPGKTNCANCYRINGSMIWVDLPGYGYAKTSRSEKKRWSKLISDYCMKRENLCGIIWLIDMRHIGVRADIDAYAWLHKCAVPFLPVLTKSDKLSQKERAVQVKKAGETFFCSSAPVTYSIRKPGSRERFWKQFRLWQDISV